MFLKKLIPMGCLTAVLAFGLPSSAQVPHVIKQAGHETGEAAKKVVTTTGEVGKKVGSGVKEGATTVGSETKRVVTGTPKGVTGSCRDGTYTKATTRSGACSKHGGVQKWY